MKIATIDLETDPFKIKRHPEPFAAGFYDGESFFSTWGDDCVTQMLAHIRKLTEPYIIFAHNGGRFDFFYFLEHLDKSDMRIINGRIVQAHLGMHQLRDSYAIMPFELAKHKKDKIDYQLFERAVRDTYRSQIITYLKGDCVYLHNLAVAYFQEFGDKLTVGSAAMNQLKQFHTFSRGKQSFDAKFRSDFYFGGRNQCFESGLIRRPLQIYDVNSMYPDVMRSCLHPIGTAPILSTRVESNTCFVVATGHNYGAFPMRAEDGSLDFTVPYGRFSMTIHEWNAALDTGCFKPVKVHKTYGFDERATFAEFVNHFYTLRNEAKQDESTNGKPPMYSLFYKFVLNSAYGKFAQDPDNFFEWRITPGDQLISDPCPICKGTGKNDWFRRGRTSPVPRNPATRYPSVEPDCTFCQGSGFQWSPAFTHHGGKYTIWQSPLMRHYYYNITTGASITGAARAVLLRGLAAASDPVYCDTDSIICSGLQGVPIHDSDIGAWKLEASGTHAAICGKKMYAVFDAAGNCVKKAHKGVRVTGEQIKRMAYGAEIEVPNEVPHFTLDGRHGFTVRKVRNTARNLRKFGERIVS